MLRRLILPLTTFLMLISCVQENMHSEVVKGDDTQVILSNYGHLEAVSDHHASPLFLSTLPKDETYDICVSERMVKKYPGFKEEIEASVNIWAYYIDREIPLNIIIKSLPHPSSDWDIDDYVSVYKRICGSNIDLYISEAHPKGNRLGYTQQKRSYYSAPRGQRTKLASFSRVLNLTNWPQSEDKKFISLEQLTGEAKTGKQILELLKNRNKTHYIPEENRYLTLTTLVHEFGHVWGLCDQYPLEDNQTNCDPLHSTLSPHGHIILNDDATMSSSDWIHEIGLHDDDIEGIIDLAERSDIASTGWALPSKGVHDFPPRNTDDSPVKHLFLKSASISDTDGVKISASMDIEGDANIIVQIKYVESESWRNQGVIFNFKDPVQAQTMNFKIRTTYSKKVEKMRLIYTKRVHQILIDETMLSEAILSNEINL